MRPNTPESEEPKKDPLFLDFGNARLGTEKTQVGVGDNAFSLNSVHGNGGFLVYDRNGNGKIDGKSELFGPDSGNGFADLAKLDEDRNGWIDENDAAFSKLSLWNNGHLSGASSAGVGAISLSNVATPFTLKDGTNSIGDIVSTGVFLSENGKVGEIRQIDLSA